MPRLAVEASNEDDVEAVCALYEEWGQGSDSFDFCAECAYAVEGETFTQSTLPSWATLTVGLPDILEVALFEIDHPPYDDMLCYNCVVCDVRLTKQDQ